MKVLGGVLEARPAHNYIYLLIFVTLFVTLFLQTLSFAFFKGALHASTNGFSERRDCFSLSSQQSSCLWHQASYSCLFLVAVDCGIGEQSRLFLMNPYSASPCVGHVRLLTGYPQESAQVARGERRWRWLRRL